MNTIDRIIAYESGMLDGDIDDMRAIEYGIEI